MTIRRLLLIVPVLTFTLISGTHLYAQSVDNGKVGIRLLNNKIRRSYGYVFYGVDGKRTRDLAACPRFSRVIYVDAKGQRRETDIQYADVIPSASGLVLTTSAPFPARFSFTIPEGARHVDCVYEATPTTDISLLRFDGPMLRIGEGFFGRNKAEALFPGLEYLGPDEVSSSTEVIRTPEHLRRTPHPYKITIPLMSVTGEGWGVSLAWNENEVWDGEHRGYSALFDSPNRIEGGNNHLAGLFLPSWPAVAENATEASPAIPIKAGTPITIRCRFLADSGNRTTAPVRHWIDLYGLPDQPATPRSFDDALQVAADAYLQTSWSPSRVGWFHHSTFFEYDKNRQTRSYAIPEAIAQLWTLSQRTQDPARRQQLLDRAELVRKTHYANGSGDPVLAFRFGSVEAAAEGRRAEIDRLIASQKPDGSWRFEPDYYQTINRIYTRELGPRGFVAAGTIARNTSSLLDYALLTGYQPAIDAAMRALERLDDFKMPKGASFWEVPMEAPEMIAAIESGEAFLKAYLLTGDERNLRYATYWAEVLLPFHYLWSAPDRPVMAYGSIPVFGTSIYTVSWLGIIVQWEAILTARFYNHLAEYNNTCDWRSLAEGMMRCAIQQQFTETEHRGLYPDTYDLVSSATPSPIGTNLTPVRFMTTLLELTGSRMTPSNAVLRDGTHQIQLTSAATIEDATLNPNVSGLQFRLTEYPSGQIVYVRIAGAPEPEEVRAGTTVLPRQPHPVAGTPGWWFSTPEGFPSQLTLALTCQPDEEISIALPSLSKGIVTPTRPEKPPFAADLEWIRRPAFANDNASVRLLLHNNTDTPLESVHCTIALQPGVVLRDHTTGQIPAGGDFLLEATGIASPALNDDVLYAVADVTCTRNDETESFRRCIETRVARAFDIDTSGLNSGGTIHGCSHPVTIPLTNRSSRTLEGTISASFPPYTMSLPHPPAFSLRPSETQVIPAEIGVNLGAPPARVKARLQVNTVDGPVPCGEEPIDILWECDYTINNVTLDGDLSEWRLTVKFIPDWPIVTFWGIDKPFRPHGSFVDVPGMPKCRSRIALQWDNDNLYIAATVDDPTRVHKSTGEMLWDGDSIQVAIDGHRDAGFSRHFDENDYEFGFALDGNNQSSSWCWWREGPDRAGPCPETRQVITYDGKQYSYEVAIPWSVLSTINPKSGAIFGINVCINNDNGNGRLYAEYAEGIATAKDPKHYPAAILLGNCTR